jgi:hydrogenase maturation protease
VTEILIIGYGNELRRDDGLGPHVAKMIATAKYPNVRVVTCFQLVPEMAADLAEPRVAVFVDAHADPDRATVELHQVTAGAMTDWSTHAGDPGALLALTHAVYGRAPEAWWVIVPGQDFTFGEGFSAVGEGNASKAIDAIALLIRKSQ